MLITLSAIATLDENNGTNVHRFAYQNSSSVDAFFPRLHLATCETEVMESQWDNNYYASVFLKIADLLNCKRNRTVRFSSPTETIQPVLLDAL